MSTDVYQLVELALDQVGLDRDNVREHYDEHHIDQLREALVSALDRGEEFINPPVVYPIGRDRYRVKVGNCRYLAARQVVEKLHFLVCAPPANQQEKIVDQLSENLLQGGLSPLDTARTLRRLRDAHALSISRLVAVLAERGIKRSGFWVRMHLGLALLHPAVQDAVENGSLGVTAAFMLRDLPGPQQAEMAERIVKEGLTLSDIARILGVSEDDELHQYLAAGSWGSPFPSHAPLTSAGSAEFAQLQLHGDLAALAKNFERRRSSTQPRDADRRDSRAVRRWELVPVSLAPDGPEQERELSALNAEGWADHASQREKELAQEALFLGGYAIPQAISLTNRITEEAERAEPWVIATLNQLAQLVYNTAPLPAGSGLAELMKIRLGRILGNLG